MSEGVSKTIYFSDEMMDILDQLCKDDHRSRSNFINYLVSQEWLRRQQVSSSGLLNPVSPRPLSSRIGRSQDGDVD
jgi:hypothetical protein